MSVREDLTNKAIEYIEAIPELQGQTPSLMLIDFAIEKYRQHRNYPNHYTEEMIEIDMNNHLSTMAMAVVDLFMRVGAEGEKNHTEPNVTRTYENAYISASIYNDVLPFVKTL